MAIAPAWLSATAAAFGQSESADWQARVRKFGEGKDWDAALRLIDKEVARAPQDMEVRSWRARVLAWSGDLGRAEKEYLEIVKNSPMDADQWMGLSGVYLREGKIPEAQKAIDTAVQLDSKRADLHVQRARVFRAAEKKNEARAEFQRALELDPKSSEARAGLNSFRGAPKHELRLGQDHDLLSGTGDFHDESLSLASQWTSRWATNVSGTFYQRPGTGANKFVESVTVRQPKWGALTVGGGIGHDNAVIPKSEAFFELDHGWKTGETKFVRSVELAYGQHWYWYQAARILTLSGGAVVYLPQEWTFSLTATGARSAFSGVGGAEWRPSGISHLAFPLTGWGEKRLSGNVFFAVGTENFAVVDQIGRFASQTYGGGLRFQITSRQDISGYAGYQKRTQNRTDTIFGLSYGVHF